MAVWTQDQERGFQFKGKAKYFVKGDWKEKVDKMPCNQGMAHKAAVIVTVEEIWDLATPCLISRK